jgi:hypothetical protein
LIGDEVAFSVLGQAGVHLSQDLGVLAIGVELLQLRPQAGALGRGVELVKTIAGKHAISFVDTWLFVLVNRNLHSNNSEFSIEKRAYSLVPSIIGKYEILSKQYEGEGNNVKIKRRQLSNAALR